MGIQQKKSDIKSLNGDLNKKKRTIDLVKKKENKKKRLKKRGKNDDIG